MVDKLGAVEVTQADREAAARVADMRIWDRRNNTGGRMREGKLDHFSEVQAFARHRLASATLTEDARERVKVLEEAIIAALACTPSIGVERGNMGQPVSYVQYDCGDPWKILRAALGNKETDRHG